MSIRRMHADEVPTDEELVTKLLTAQFPHWAQMPVRPVESSGTDHTIYRLGDDLAVRLPRIGWAVGQAVKEQRWLPGLAPLLPLKVPITLALGQPAEGYPWQWSVCTWLRGENATPDRFRDVREAAADLGRFVAALHAIATTDAPPPATRTTARGVPLAVRDAYTRDAIARLGDRIDAAAILAVWERLLAAPVWPHPPVWVHGDLSAGNLLVENGRLTGVIDFGCLGVGDPAVDLMVAWNLFSADARKVYRTELGVDDATWTRGQGWALSTALAALPYYWDTSPYMVRQAWFTIEAVLAG